MDEPLHRATELFRTLGLYGLNGVLALAYTAWEQKAAVLTLGAFLVLLVPAPDVQRPWIACAAIAGVLAALFAPLPVPFLLAGMALAGAGAVRVDRFDPDGLRWRATGALALYAGAALAWLAYSRSLSGADATAGHYASRQRGSINIGFSVALPLAAALSSSAGGQSGRADSTAASTSDAVSEGWGQGETRSWGHSVGESTSHGLAHTESYAETDAVSHTSGTSYGISTGHTDSRSDTDSFAHTDSQAHTESRSHTTSHGVTASESSGVSHSSGTSGGTSTGTSSGVTHSTGANWGSSQSTGSSTGVTASQGSSHGTSESSAQNWSESESQSVSSAVSASSSTSHATSLAESDSTSQGSGWTLGASQTTSEGASAGQSLSHSESTGGSAALAPQAFHGPAVPTPVLTVPADESLRLHALAFRPSLTPSPTPFGIDLLWSRWGTLLTPGMLAAYTAPNLFEEGTVMTVQEKLPPLAFYPESRGDVVPGHQVSPETGELTRVPLKLARTRHFHTAFVGDTGYGKSVAAERLVYETTLHWQMRTIVLDFGAGWRKLLNAPGLEDRVEIRQLSPGGVRPLRWNPLQVGAVILPEVQWRAFCDIFGAIAKLGVRRQVAELREALRRVYLRAGVLVDDPDCRQDAVWDRVRAGEEGTAGAAVGTPLGALTPEARQHAGSQDAHIQIVFEEANKILAGLDNSGDDDGASGASTAEQFAAMWRDSRKYDIWLHLITQSPSLISPGILSSCNNVFVGQVKNARDRDLVIAALHRSEKGFVDEGWRRFLASLPVARAVAKLGYAFERADLEPCSVQPLQLLAPEPTDAEIVARLGNEGLGSPYLPGRA